MKVKVVSPSIEKEVSICCPSCKAWNIVYVPLNTKAKGKKICWRCRAEIEYEEEEGDAASNS